MNIKTVALYVGIVVAGLGVLGLVMGETRLADSMNIDMMLDIARIALGGFLIYGSTRSVETAKTAFSVFGIAYLGMFVLGLISSTLFGLLPDGLGWMDNVLHLGGGVLGLYYMMKSTNKLARA